MFEADAATVQEILETAPCCQVKKELSSQFNTRSQTIEKLPIFYCGATWAENKKAMEAYGPMFSMRPHSSLKITAIETAPVKTTSIPAIKTNKKINWPMIGLALLTGILPVLIVVSLAALFKKKSLTTYFREVFYLESKQSSGSQTDSEKKTGLAEAKIEKEQPALISSPLSTPKASITTASPSDHPENSKRAGEIKPDTL